MTSHDQYLASAFPAPPLTAYRRQANLRNMLIRAKVPVKPKAYLQRKIKGMVKCGKSCTACPYVKEEKIQKFGKKGKWILN